MMSKKDYTALAAAVKTQLAQDSTAQACKAKRAAVAGTINRMLPHLRTNPAFDNQRFIEACGLRCVDPEERTRHWAAAVSDDRFTLAA